MTISRMLLMLITSAFLLSGCVSGLDEIAGDFDPAHFSREEPLEGAGQLNARVNLGLGSLKVVKGREAVLFDLDIDYDGNQDKPEVDFSRSGNKAELRVDLKGRKGSGWWGDDNKIDLSLSPEVDLDAGFITGVGENIVDLTGLKVEKLEIINGVGNTEIYMDEINRTACRVLEVTNGIGHLEMTGIGNYAFDDFRFSGGIGDSSLDFSGEWRAVGDIDLKVGMGSLKVMVPHDLGVRIESSKSFLSNLDMPGFDQVGNEFVSGNISEAEKEIVIKLHTGIGDVRFVRQ